MLQEFRSGTLRTLSYKSVERGFAATIDTDDTIYWLQQQIQGVLLLYIQAWWDLNPLDLPTVQYIYYGYYIAERLHTYFLFKKLPVIIWQCLSIHKNANDKTPYIEYSWKKNSLSNILSSIENSASLLPVKNGIIHYASVVRWNSLLYQLLLLTTQKSWVHKASVCPIEIRCL